MSPIKKKVLTFYSSTQLRPPGKFVTALIQVRITGKPILTAIYYLFDMFDPHKFAHFLLPKTRHAICEQTGEETLLTEGISAE